MRAEIDCVAITDHNSGEWIDDLKEALQDLESNRHPDFRALHLFPGVEISVHGGFHLLAIFDKDKSTADITSLVGAVKFRGRKGQSDAVTEISGREVIDEVVAAGGIAIPAHTDQAKGLLQLSDTTGSMKSRLDPTTVEQVLGHPGVIAIEVVDRNTSKPALYNQGDYSFTEVQGSDSHHLDGSNGTRYPGSQFTWVKMGDPSLEGLYLALLDGGGFSIRRSDHSQGFKPFPQRQHVVESIEISRTRFMGVEKPVKFELNPMLNAIIGGARYREIHGNSCVASRGWARARTGKSR